MHRQSTFRQSRCDRLHHFFRLLLSMAVNHRVIGIAGEPALWMSTLHPDIESVVHEQVHQNRAYHSALWRTAFPRQLLSLGSLERRSQPSFDVQQYPAPFDVGVRSLQQETMIDLIEGRFDVELDHPVILPAPFS